MLDHESMMEMVSRREKFSRMQPSCPSCETKQVQLCDWSTNDGKFKCRHCKHDFVISISCSDSHGE